MKKLKKNLKHIKLILIITILILLILSGITVLTLIKQQGFFSEKKASSNGIKFVYELTSYENNKFKILIKVIDEVNGIDTIQFPDGDIQKCDGKTIVGIDYEVEEGVDYEFIAKTPSGEEKKEIVNLTQPEQPIFPTGIGYPTVTLKGVEKPKVVIDFDKREEFINYYSLDNGETWNLYTGPIDTSISVIKAKSIHKQCQDVFVEKVATLQVPIDILTETEYDGDFSTETNHGTLNPGYNECSFLVDNSTWGQYCSINYFVAEQGSPVPLIVYLYGQDDKVPEYKKLLSSEINKFNTAKFQIPEGIYKIRLVPTLYRNFHIAEVGINFPEIPQISINYDETKINKVPLDYPILTQNGVMNCSINPEIGTRINFEITNEQKDEIESYYSLDGGENWQLYTGNIETTYQGENLIQVKSINKYYKIETNINIIKNYIKDLNIACTNTNAVTKEAYDGDKETFSKPGYMKVDSLTIGMRGKFKYKSNGTRTINYFKQPLTYDDLIDHSPNGQDGIFEIIKPVPEGAYWLVLRF